MKQTVFHPAVLPDRIRKVMRTLVIGGTGFIGPHIIRDLCDAGHEVTVVSRGSTTASLPAGVTHFIADRRRFAEYASQLRRVAPDVVIDLILSSGRQAAELMRTFRGVARRVVAVSSMDVYRAVGVVHGLEPGPLEPLPLTEDSPLRTRLQTYPAESLKMLQQVFGWLDEDYDKIPVERAVLSDEALPATVVRLPMVYGPGDRLHRLHPILKRIDDGRKKILFSEDMAQWRGSRGYVEDVASAIVLAVVSPFATGRVYNVAEERAWTELEWAQRIASAVSWDGEFVLLPRDRVPKHLAPPGNTAQHWVASSARIRQELRYRERVGLDEAIIQTVAWERANPPESINPHQFDYDAEDAVLGE